MVPLRDCTIAILQSHQRTENSCAVGKLRVLLTDHEFDTIPIGNGPGEIGAGEYYQATILFVRRKKCP